jgi:hypothetical protein
MMEWLFLLVVVPAVLVPAVLLWGFAGCGSFGEAPAPDDGSQPVPPPAPALRPAAPTNLAATPISTSRIDLTWAHPSAGGVRFVVSLQRTDGSWDEKYAGEATPITTKSHSDVGLDEGKRYTYRVRAVGADPALPSDWSNPPVQQSTFGRTFEQDLTGERQRANMCIVQRIEAARLSRGGKRLMLTLRRPTRGNVVIKSIHVSQAAMAGDPQNSATDLTLVYQPVTPLTLLPDPAAPDFVVPEVVAYALDPSEPLLVIFEIDTPGFVPHANADDVTVFYCPAGEAENPVRSLLPDEDSQGRVCLIRRIDVA